MKDNSPRYDYIIELLEKTLSKKRFRHSLNVADEAKRLALKHNGDVEKCYLAGLLHDIKKEETPQAMKSQAILNPFPLEAVEEATPALWHSAASAYFAKAKLGIDDVEVLGAIRWHTSAKADMTLTEKIVYLADLVSLDREYKGVEEMRELAYNDIDSAMFVAMKFAIEDVTQKGGLLALSTVNAYNFYQKYKKENI